MKQYQDAGERKVREGRREENPLVFFALFASFAFIVPRAVTDSAETGL